LANVSNCNVAFCALSAVVGVVVALAQRLTHRGPITIDTPNFPHWLRVYDQIAHASTVFPWNLIFLAVLVVLFVAAKKGPAAWALAFGIGGLLGMMAANAVL
jgi:hypothetical protein